MRVTLVGVNHNTAPVSVRERLSFGKAGAAMAARRLVDGLGVREAVVLSTCNRTEIYAAAEHASPDPMVRLLVECGVPESELKGCLYVQEGHDSAQHLHRVAAGLDSLVLGEAQILGQVKDALAHAQEAGAAGPALTRLFQSATTAGKRVRTETGLTRGAVSISHAAVELAKRIFGDLRGLNAMILGAGEMSEVTARLLADAGVASMLVANRTYERAQDLAGQIGGTAVRFDDFHKHLARADVVVCSTAAPHPVVKLDDMRRVAGRRRGRPLFLIDIAVPRDVEPAVGDLEDVFLFCIDDLKEVVEENLAERRGEIAASEAIVSEETDRFLAWLRSMDAGPLIAALVQKGEEVVRGELAKIGGKLQHLSDRDRDQIERMMHGVAKRLLREPIQAVKLFAAQGEAAHPLDTVQALFGLCPPDAGPAIGEGLTAMAGPGPAASDSGVRPESVPEPAPAEVLEVSR